MPATRSWRAAVLAACLVVPAGSLVAGPSATAADNGRLTGTVLDDDGARLPGASVRLVNDSGDVVAQANAGADGRYQLAAAKASYRLVVTHADGAGWLKAQVAKVTVGSDSELDVVALPPPAHLRVRLDTGAVAVNSVFVSLVGDDTYTAVVPTDGVYDVAAEPGRYRLRIRVNLPQTAGTSNWLLIDGIETFEVAGDRTIDVRLPLTSVQIGTPDTNGPLRPGELIEISSGPDPAPPVSIGSGLTATPTFKTGGLTDSSGFARIPALPTPALSASFEPPPTKELDDMIQLQYSLAGIDARGTNPVIRFDPKPLVTLSGRFTDDAGNPIGGGQVEVSGPNGFAEEFTRADGSFTTRVPAGRYTVDVTGRTVYPAGARLVVPDLDLTADRAATFRLPLHAGTVAVRRADTSVPDATILGGTVSLAPVATEYPGSRGSVGLSPLRTELDGRATVVAPAGVPLKISVRPPTGVGLAPVTADITADATMTTVRLPAGGAVPGQVRSTSGSGLPRVTVTVEDNAAVLPTSSASDGAFTLHAPPGPANLRLSRGVGLDTFSDGPDKLSLTGNVTLAPGQLLDLLLPSATTDVRFVDGDGEPLPVEALATAEVGPIATGAGTFSGRIEDGTDCCSTPRDRLTVRSFGRSMGSVSVQNNEPGEPVHRYAWIRAAGVPFADDGRVTLAVATPTSDPGGALPPTTTTTTTTTGPGTPGPSDTTSTTAPPSGGDPVAVPAASGRSGYWMVTAAGAVHAFGEARHYGEPAGTLGGARAVRLEPTPTGHGYWVLDDRGVVRAYGDAVHRGNVNRAVLAGGETATSLSRSPSGEGYWVFTTRGRVLTFGDAAFFGDVSSLSLNGPVLGSVATATGRGYYMVASDGGIFTFGDARFHGSTGNVKLNKPVMGMAPAADGTGYWLVASDGGIFAFGVPFHGSMGAVRLNKPVSGIVPGRDGYLMVAQDGGIFSFGHVAFHGSLGATPPASPVVWAALLP